jgi:uncharacterized protein involved in exopolysaccharide biosynthesis
MRQAEDALLAKPNYQFEKRQRDLAKKNKHEEKRQQQLADKAAGKPVDADNSSDATVLFSFSPENAPAR